MGAEIIDLMIPLSVSNAAVVNFMVVAETVLIVSVFTFYSCLIN